MAPGKTCKRLSGKTAHITKRSANMATAFVRQNPWLAAGITTTLAVAGGLLARQRRVSRRQLAVSTAGEGI